MIDEAAFWSRLEYRLTQELAGLPTRSRGALWCDGISPATYWLDDDPPRIEGYAWLGYTHCEEWRFTLFLPAQAESPSGVDWSALLPPVDKTCWLAIDHQRRVLQIEPVAAVADLNSE